MKKIITTIIIATLFISCSKDEENSVISATEYGIYVKSNTSGPVDFDYRFYNFDTGEVYRQGSSTTSNGTILFPVTDKEKTSDYIIVDISVSNENSISPYYIAKNGSMYLNKEDNSDATSIFELNNMPFISGREVYEGAISIDSHESIWTDNFSNN